MRPLPALFAAALLPLALLACGCGVGNRGGDKIKVAAVYTSSLEEPWAAVLHQVLLDGERELEMAYDYAAETAPAGLEQAVRDYAERGYRIIFAQAYAAEDAARRAARDFPEIAFCLGSAFGPVEPNVAVFDAWVHEPAYLSGMIAARLTRSGRLGVVAGRPSPSVNRLVNAFVLGARESNPGAKVSVDYLDRPSDPGAAYRAALAQIAAGADIVYAERYGAIRACREKGVRAIGSLQDQNSHGPDTVVTGPVWDLWPTVREIVGRVGRKEFQPVDLAFWGTMAARGASLAPYYGFEKRLPAGVREAVEDRQREILSGSFRVPVVETEAEGD